MPPPKDKTATENGKTATEYWHVNAETQGGKAVEQLVNEFNARK